jgi:hypothetical protein
LDLPGDATEAGRDRAATWGTEQGRTDCADGEEEDGENLAEADEGERDGVGEGEED